MIEQILTVAIPIAFVVWGTLWTYMLVNEYKRKKARKLKVMLDMIPCLCGHERWIHNPWSQDPTRNMRCHDFKWDRPCKCRVYKMDNLAYLEKVSEHA